MVISKEILSDYKEVYEKAVNYVNEESKNDPSTDPYCSHYKARELLLELRKQLKIDLATLAAHEEDTGDDELIYKIVLAFVCRDLGRIYVFTEEVQTGENMFKECVELMKEHQMKPEAIIPYMGALNELGIVYANREEHQKSFEMLDEAEKLYKAFQGKGDAMTLYDVFGTREEVEPGKGPAELESLYTLCTFYLAQVYGHLGNLEKSADYCHMTLQRQLAQNSYEPIDFSLNAATLSQYLIGLDKFKEARHHLAAATVVMTEYEKKMLTEGMEENQRLDTIETYKHRYADVARCWAKYGLALLATSKNRLFEDEGANLATDVAKLTVEPNMYRFDSLSVAAVEDRVSVDYCLTFDDAKLIYHFVISWLDIAKDYYKAETEATEYAKIIKDYAELYDHIAFFEEDTNNQIKMQKRRARYYEELLELLNPTFYMSICRDSWYGAALAHCAILDIRLDVLRDSSSPSPQDVQKVNQTIHRAIKHFKDMIQSYMDKDGKALKPNLDLQEERTALFAYFHLGRLHFKFITPDAALQLENMSNSLKYYKMFIDGCAERKSAAEIMQAEVGVCREMVDLLPLKISNLNRRLTTSK